MDIRACEAVVDVGGGRGGEEERKRGREGERERGREGEGEREGESAV